ncbi:unnamed protein product [Didymodactylos carnosus]|uniref:Uncharacterized protein n=2 Tax=Didymodactylos carnosus TaxID=1234261 RepID=A0A8S2DQ88_9BILA|nr:unnamed protein product [Didymodactylos carnosus]CAF3771476.1 unnamed protein product [Didymodactylos carnosus]
MINVSSTLNILLRHVRSLIPFVIILPNTRQALVKKMYLDYLKNCKFTLPTTLPLINFIQRSLVELYSLDPTVTYQHGFVFLRQLAVHLRTATQNKKPENIQRVYNWQFVHALGLWTSVIGVLYNNKEKLIQQLVHPLPELIVGTIRLVPTARYYPLRFHCVRLLIKLAQLTPVFVSDGLMDQFYELVVNYLVHYTHHVTFPELVYPLILKCI